jgi:hypothetical protein
VQPPVEPSADLAVYTLDVLPVVDEVDVGVIAQGLATPSKTRVGRRFPC